VSARATRALLRRAAALRHGRPTALLVPVDGLGIEPRTATGLPPHITVLYPFVPARRAGPELERALRETFEGFAPFDVALTAIGRFPGVLYLAPEPPGPLVALTEACTRRWPEHPPYEGAHDAVVPHLTLAEGPEPAGFADAVEQRLPLHTRVEELWLMAPGDGGGWRRCASVPLSGSSASPSR
jgi:2'-5' RNA ligase